MTKDTTFLGMPLRSRIDPALTGSAPVAQKPLALYVSPAHPARLEALGLDTVYVYPPPGVFDVPAYLEEHDLKPDILLQDEVLAPRVLCKGLWELDCPKVFWSQDPHLNHSWQRTACAQFDVVACTQKAWVEPLRRACPGRVEWLTWCAEAGPCPPHASRPHPVAFVGRVTEHRPLRGRFVDFLRSLGPVRIARRGLRGVLYRGGLHAEVGTFGAHPGVVAQWDMLLRLAEAGEALFVADGTVFAPAPKPSGPDPAEPFILAQAGRRMNGCLDLMRLYPEVYAQAGAAPATTFLGNAIQDFLGAKPALLHLGLPLVVDGPEKYAPPAWRGKKTS